LEEGEALWFHEQAAGSEEDAASGAHDRDGVAEGGRGLICVGRVGWIRGKRGKERR
jgi:hypothetical protein